MLSRLLALTLFVPLLAQAACTRPLRVPFEDWRPYSFMADGRHTGLETELLAAVAKEAGCRLSYVREVPRNRRLPMLLAGELDLLIAATPVPEPGAWYTRPYRDEVLGVFMRADEARMDVRSLDELLRAGLRLVTHRGPASVAIINDFRARGLLTWFEEYAKGVQLMQLGRGDVLLGDSVAIAFAARAADVPLIELPITLLRDPVTYKLSRKSLTEADLRAFNRAIQHLEASGELQRIRARWLGQAGLKR
ncbi:ABC-type amino acid transport substrate-binding protein [Pelomonas saccharophila]|uniref:ABC-type amino acid transport substrate-binding protein n=1 Tax=Roseateles saccharophilus TaxID=304 RepID=A0ABU1YI60_ROSSA|nr:transporter substrate-binding domain-containing protein [Roseateles saccharophilus]MDR7268537.1 ABC-type amino acid transport substrate-binding protein [Roseateles saccharophilus]